MSADQEFAAAGAAFKNFCETVRALRDRQRGCQWMIEQTQATLRRYMIEEAYEAVDAINENDPQKICDELGDVLLQVVLHSEIAREHKAFRVEDAIAAIEAKMRRRHPHVFETDEGAKLSIPEIEQRYEKIKAAEKTQQGGARAGGFFAEAAKVHPALQQALAIGKLARRINFDWPSPTEVMAQLESEVAELRAEVQATKPDRQRMADELGDVFFSLVQLARHLDLDPEIAVMDGNRKFLRRFARMEQLAAERRQDIAALSTDALEALWREAKASPAV